MVGLDELDGRTRRLYALALEVLQERRVPFLVGGAYALERYTGVGRDTKDLDIFARRCDLERVLAVLAEAGYETEVTFPHWLAKASVGDRCIDVVYSSGNGAVEVDDAWFAHAVPARVLDIPVALCPPEEMIWSKAFIMERERYDGADIAHLLQACARRLDWGRLLARFGRRWRVLLSHLVLFGFIYPGERSTIPDAIMAELLERVGREQGRAAPGQLCQGTLLSRQQYLVDIERRGYADARIAPVGTMSAGEIAAWTAAITRSHR
jgi:Uncharacterised nucleotidyltransferase